MTELETTTDAWKRRDAATSSIDFSMMYAAHDAFHTRQLHVHHTTEDASLWPRVRAAIGDPRESAISDAMESEHENLDPLIESVDEALRRRDADLSGPALGRLTVALAAHMRHDEQEALPLVARRVGQEGWDLFGRDIRRTQGIRGAAVYVPWVLDKAPEHVGRAVLGLLPPPVRVVCRRLWEPRDRKADHL